MSVAAVRSLTGPLCRPCVVAPRTQRPDRLSAAAAPLRNVTFAIPGSLVPGRAWLRLWPGRSHAAAARFAAAYRRQANVRPGQALADRRKAQQHLRNRALIDEFNQLLARPLPALRSSQDPLTG